MKYTALAALLFLVGAGCSLDSSTTAEVTTTPPASDTTTEELPPEGLEERTPVTEASSGTYAITEGEANYISQKVFLSKPTAEVIGTTGDVTGSVVVDTDTQTVSVNATIANTFTTDSDMRDGDVEKMLGGPIAVAGSNIALADIEAGSVVLSLTIAGVTKDVPFEIYTNTSGEKITASGSGVFNMSEFELDPPSLLNVYTVTDELVVQFTITTMLQ